MKCFWNVRLETDLRINWLRLLKYASTERKDSDSFRHNYVLLLVKGTTKPSLLFRFINSDFLKSHNIDSGFHKRK